MLKFNYMCLCKAEFLSCSPLSLSVMSGSQVVQLEELLAVRHSVFVVGNAGTGKSQVLRSLNKTYHNMKRRPVWADLNPKAVTNDELFGIINPATREWKDGEAWQGDWLIMMMETGSIRNAGDGVCG